MLDKLKGLIKNKLLIKNATQGNITAVRDALENGADVNARDIGVAPVTALAAASIEGHTEIVKLLIEKGADVNAKGSRFFYGTAYTNAILGSHTEIAKLLKEKGAK